MEILVVEDETAMADLLRQGLEEEGHIVVVARDGSEGFDFACLQAFDAIVLDIMLPKCDGLTVARRLRAARYQTPIVVLTAKDSPGNIVEGLDCGADDYLTKPFSFEELLARLRAITRRGRGGPACLSIADLELNPATRVVTRAGSELSLTRTEHLVLELLMRRAGRVVSREAIISAVWGRDSDVQDNTVDVFMSQVRRKVDQPGMPRLVQTIRGIGYSVRTTSE